MSGRFFSPKLWLALGLSGLLGVYFWLGLGESLSFAGILAVKGRLDALFASHPYGFSLGYFLLYAACAALGLPLATLLGILAGAIFGLWLGTLLISFASSLGALGACVLARYFLRDFLELRFGAQLAKLDQGLRQEGAYYLFFLRLAPVFPYFLVNLLLGLTRMRLATYYIVSQVGMLPGTLLYLSLGRELGRADSLPQVFTLKIIIIFSLIGLLPLAVKRIWRFFSPELLKS